MSGPGGGGLIPRRGAVGLLRGVLDHGRMLPDLVAAEDGPLRDLAPDEAARAQRLATGTLRYVTEINALLAPRLRKPPPAEVMHILRLAAWEILVAEVPAYAAGDSAVRQVRGLRRHQHLSGLVNAVVRGLGRDGAEAWAARPPHRLPKWLDTPVRAAFGEEAAEAIATAHQLSPPTDLTPKDPAQATDVAGQMGADLLPTGSLRLASPGQISAQPGYAEGAWWVQDAAAAMPVRLLGDIHDLEVID
ncbi:MAG: transcription antitermination factor NusB, partial [Pseudomonadota bacterium]